MKILSRMGCLGAALAACALLAAAPAAQAQDTSAAQQREQAQKQPGNNGPVWHEVHSGAPNTTTVEGREAGVLIQQQARFPGQRSMSSAGEAWRNYRNGPVTVWGGWLLVLVALAIAAYYFVKGPIGLREKPTGRTIERFGVVQRVTHWCLAISFVVLGLSGLVMLFGKFVLLPLIGYTLFAWLADLSKYLHNFVGPFFILSALVFIVIYLKDNLPGARDVEWVAKAGGLFSGTHVPSGRFNAGEKMYFWGGVVILTIVMSASGLILLFPNLDQLRTTMQQANIVHAIGAILYIAMAFGHIYMGTVGVDGAYQAMRSGYVDETWAKEHHSLWYDEVKSGKSAASAGAVPAGAARAKRSEAGE